VKKITKSDEPDGLKVFREANPQGLWDDFDEGNVVSYDQLRKTLLDDQHGLCAYCEINLILNLDENYPRDFRVEHFHPKEDKATAKNWGLDWQNLLAVCHGGQVSSAGIDRHTYPDVSCDVPKQGKLLDDIIINPLLHLKNQTQLFNINSGTGELYIHHRCPPDLSSRAANTLQEDYLNLNAKRLCDFRLEQIQTIQDHLSEHTIETILTVFLQPNQPFFSTVRAYFDKAAEQHLSQIGYFDEAAT
jgi:uncharacterized protein (TIGR02646 family)